MSNYTSENTVVLATRVQAGGNMRMLLLHKMQNGRLEYIIGSYFTVLAPLYGGLADEQGVLYDERTMAVIDDDSIEAGRLSSEAWAQSWPLLVKRYSWDWGHYFSSVFDAVDYWRRDVLGEGSEYGIEG